MPFNSLQEITTYFNTDANIPKDYITEYKADDINKLQDAIVFIANKIINDNITTTEFNNHQNYSNRGVTATANSYRHVGEAVQCYFKGQSYNLQSWLDYIFINYIGY